MVTDSSTSVGNLAIAAAYPRPLAWSKDYRTCATRPAAPWRPLNRLRAIACVVSASTATGHSMMSKTARAMLPATNTRSASSRRLSTGSRTSSGFGTRRAQDSEGDRGCLVGPVVAARECRDLVAMRSLLSQRRSRPTSIAGSSSLASAGLFSRYVANPNHMKSYTGRVKPPPLRRRRKPSNMGNGGNQEAHVRAARRRLEPTLSGP